MTTFTKRKLNELIEFSNGKMITNNGGNYPIYGGNGILGYTDNYNYENILIVGRVGAYCGSTYKSKGKCWVSDNAIAGKPVNPEAIDFNYYLMKMLNLGKMQIGSSQPLITQTILNSIEVKVPTELSEQIQISKVLSCIDDKIALNNKINKELEQMAKTLYEYWFVQFDFPDEKGRPYKSANGKMVYNDILKREIPEGWEVRNIEELCNVLTGKEDANFATQNGKYAFFTCGDEVLRCDKPAFKGKSILVAGNGNFNVKYYEGEFNAYQRTYVLIPENDIYIGTMYRALLDNINRFTKGSNGSIVKFITKGDIATTKVLIPNNTELLKPLNQVLSSIEKNKKQNQKLTELRDFLLPLLMNGQVSVQN